MASPILRIFRVVSPFFRRRRMRLFLARVHLDATTSVLDVGGYSAFWAGSGVASPITLLNLHPSPETDLPPNHRAVPGDGTALPYADGSFDLVFSNSVIEHVGTWEAQQKFAAECLRVGRTVWVQTPARSFPIEPHYLTPFIHYLPKRWRRRLLRRFTVWGWLTKPSPERVGEMLDEIRLLSRREMEQLFPGCEIIAEKVFGLTKSLTAFRTAPVPVPGAAAAPVTVEPLASACPAANPPRAAKR